MTPKERIYALRLMKKMDDWSEYFGVIGVDVEIRDQSAEQGKCKAEEG